MKLTMADVKRINREKGQFFFSPQTIRFFNSRIESTLMRGGFFITSERFDENSPRKYTVRRFVPHTGEILTEGGFQTFKNKEDAQEFIRMIKRKRM